jgi:CRISPR-associated endonuclease Csy4
MTVYLEITLLPDVDISLNFLLQKVYQQLHLKFVAMQRENSGLSVQKGGLQPIGVSFPKYNSLANTLGDKIRLFAENVATLERFNAKHTFRKLNDYVHVTNIRDVPENITAFACFQRVQLKSSNTRLARRKAKRENISFEEALFKLRTHAEQRTDLPFMSIKSASNGENFRLFVVYSQKTCASEEFAFSTYGLSDKSTVPVF